MSDPTVCHVPPVAPRTQPKPVNLPAIPPAQPNLQSLTTTVNALRQALQLVTGQQGVQGSNGDRGPPGFNGRNADSNATWTENSQRRVTKTVRVFQNNDETSKNWVDVEQINSISMENGATAQTWRWDR